MIFVSAFFRRRASLGCELVALRSQLTFYKESIRHKKQPRPRFNPAFRLLWVLLSTAWGGWKPAAELMKPKTILKWQQDAFLQWWRWKSRRKGGRPAISPEMRALIRRLSRENILWTAETIHGHLLRLGFDPPCPDTIRKYIVRPKGGTGKSQSWLTFLRNHMPVSWAMDFFTVPTLCFQVLYVFVVLNHSRRQVVHFRVTAYPTIAWVIQQLREALPFGLQPTYLFRDNDGIYGEEESRFLVGTGSIPYGSSPLRSANFMKIRLKVSTTLANMRQKAYIAFMRRMGTQKVEEGSLWFLLYTCCTENAFLV
jgi:putative transposase